MLDTLGLGTEGREGATDEPDMERPSGIEEPRGRESAYGELSEGGAWELCALGGALLYGVPAPACLWSPSRGPRPATAAASQAGVRYLHSGPGTLGHTAGLGR